MWKASSPSKRWCETFFLFYSPIWIFFVALIVTFEIYEDLNEFGYMVVGIICALPFFIIPFFIQKKIDAEKPLFERFWFKANIWIFIVSFIGNYLWTHYFYTVLGASYTFPSWRINDVPICLIFMTHAYFCFYYALSNIFIRIVRNSVKEYGPFVQNISEAIFVFIFSYFVAFMETFTIEKFPYYTFVNRDRMYTIGSLFYAIYFFVTFPMFFRLEENTKAKKLTLNEIITNSLAACMLVTLLLDFWRLAFGPLSQRDLDTYYDQYTRPEIPWLK